MTSRSETLRLVLETDAATTAATATPPPMQTPGKHDIAALAVRTRLKDGMVRAPLSAPLTAFNASGGVDVGEFRRHLQAQVAARPGAIFVCCGPGEFWSLSRAEFEELVGIAVDVAGGHIPVIAGIGHHAALALEFAESAERAGAEGGLLLISSKMMASDTGLVPYTRAVSAGTRLPLLLCHGTRTRLTDRTVHSLSRIPNVIGVVDCAGDVAQAQRLRLLSPPNWLFVNGSTNAEMGARPYASIGIPACASSVHAFAPEIARSFLGGLSADDETWVLELLREFFLPWAELLLARPGYQVSLPKAAARLRGHRVGGVRAPLVEPPLKHLRSLEGILRRGLDLVSQDVVPV